MTRKRLPIVIAEAQQRFWLPILLYHRVVPTLPAEDPYGNCVSVAAFGKQLQWLADQGYQCISLRDVEQCYFSSEADAAPLPRRSFVITFDDGYQDNYQYAWPLLQKYGFTATIFLVTAMVGGDNSFDAASRYSQVAMLSVTEIQEMHRHGMHFESHTCSHPDSLVEMPSDKLQDELTRSRSNIEDLVGAPSRYFAYPHSKLDKRVEDAVEQAGYTLACGGVGTRFSQFCLHRIEPRERQGLGLDLHLRERYLKWWLKNRVPR